MDRVLGKAVRRLSTGVALLVGVALAATTGTGAVPAETPRKVYISAVDASGAPVTDLTAADIAVKEDGKDRQVASLARATEQMDVHLFVDDNGSGAYQGGVLEILQALIEHAQFTIYELAPQAVKILDASKEFEGIQAALNRLGPRGKVDPHGEQLAEALGTVAREFREKKPARPVIVVMTIGGDQGHRNQDLIMNDVRRSGANVNVIFLQNAGIGLVLGDSPRETGGQSVRIGSVNAIPPAVKQITDALLNQYALTYTLPDGVDPSDRVNITTTRSGIKLLAPSRIPKE